VVSEADRAYVRSRQLVVPVAGIRAARVADSFTDARSGGRTHYAVDILAPRGTPVLAADDGRIWKLRQGGLGGIALYALDPDERVVYYYAHLDAYRPGLFEGMAVARGDTLGFVGTTGNAPKDVPHLHFQVAMVGPDRRYWTGIPLNPLPLLREAEAVLATRGSGGGDPGDGNGRVARPAAGGGLPALAIPARRSAGSRRPTVPAVPEPPADTGNTGRWEGSGPPPAH
jgi:hypothetical protein